MADTIHPTSEPSEAVANTSASVPTDKDSLEPRIPAVQRGPPLWKIHELPAPIRTFPLPSFYPSNPLSLLQIAYTWIRQILTVPREPSVILKGIWSPETRSVHVVDPKSIRALWEQGFYGKGHLSRSEPNWLKREQARKGEDGGHVAEVFTAKRREERMQMKWDRARKEQEAIQRTRYEEARIAPVRPSDLLALPNSRKELDLLIYGSLPEAIDASTIADAALDEPSATSVDSLDVKGGSAASAPMLNGHAEMSLSNGPNGQPCSPAESPFLKRRKSVRFSTTVESTTFQHSDPPSPKQTMNANGNGKIPDGILTNGTAPPGGVPSSLSIGESVSSIAQLKDWNGFTPNDNTGVVDKEHLQLTLEEAFWLSFSFGILTVEDPETDSALSLDSLLSLYRRHSYFPPKTTELQPDDPFMIQYVVYHHFRSLGWVTRPGIKFGCDWLLYHRGPAFSHAEFAIIVLPSYSNQYWEDQGRATPKHSWHWLHMINRVQSTAMKTLVLVYVDIPPPTEETLDIASTLKRYKIREVMVKRWLINRNRD